MFGHSAGGCAILAALLRLRSRVRAAYIFEPVTVDPAILRYLPSRYFIYNWMGAATITYPVGITVIPTKAPNCLTFCNSWVLALSLKVHLCHLKWVSGHTIGSIYRPSLSSNHIRISLSLTAFEHCVGMSKSWLHKPDASAWMLWREGINLWAKMLPSSITVKEPSRALIKRCYGHMWIMASDPSPVRAS